MYTYITQIKSKDEICYRGTKKIINIKRQYFFTWETFIGRLHQSKGPKCKRQDQL